MRERMQGWWRRVGPVGPSDLALAAATVVVNVIGVAAELGEAHRPVPPAAGGYAIAVLTGLLLVGRRRAPIGTAVAVGLGAAAYHFLGYPGYAPGDALFGACYSVAAYGSGMSGLAVAAVVIAGSSVVPLLPPHGGVSSAWTIVGPALGMAMATAAGEATRYRRVALEEQLRRVRQGAAEEAQRRVGEERLLIARELHDVLAHTITVIGVQAAAGADALADRPRDAAAAFATIRGATKEAMGELRSTVRLLRNDSGPTPISPQPGIAALSGLIDQTGAGGVPTRLEVDGAPMPLPKAVELAVYRIVQEALTNVIRHAGARSAVVRLGYGPDLVRVEVIDDGVGYPATADPSGAQRALSPEDVPGSGHGLIGMRERARAVGGELRTGPADGGSGFRVCADLPTGVQR